MLTFGDTVVHNKTNKVGSITATSNKHPFLVVAEFDGKPDLYNTVDLKVANDLIETDPNYLVDTFNVFLEDPQVNSIVTASIDIPNVTIHKVSFVNTSNQIEFTYVYNNSFKCGSKKVSLAKAVSLVKELENKIS